MILARFLRGLRAADHQEAVERAKMKRILVLISALVLGLSSLGFAADQISEPTDKVVIDRTTASRTLNNYVMWTRDSIQKVWTTPINLMTSDALKGKIAVMYEVARDGSLMSLQLLRGSGNSDLDRSLLGAIRAASPFPEFPGEITANRVLIKANFIVADLPVVPVLRVEHRTRRARSIRTTADRISQKIYMGGSRWHSSKKRSIHTKR